MGHVARERHRFVPRLECLEGRIVPSSDTWQGGWGFGNNQYDWNLPGNWSTGSVPTSATDVIIDRTQATAFPPVINSGGSGSCASINLSAYSAGQDITLTVNGSLTICGGSGTDSNWGQGKYCRIVVGSAGTLTVNPGARLHYGNSFGTDFGDNTSALIYTGGELDLEDAFASLSPQMRVQANGSLIMDESLTGNVMLYSSMIVDLNGILAFNSNGGVGAKGGFRASIGANGLSTTISVYGTAQRDGANQTGVYPNNTFVKCTTPFLVNLGGVFDTPNHGAIVINAGGANDIYDLKCNGGTVYFRPGSEIDTISLGLYENAGDVVVQSATGYNTDYGGIFKMSGGTLDLWATTTIFHVRTFTCSGGTISFWIDAGSTDASLIQSGSCTVSNSPTATINYIGVWGTGDIGQTWTLITSTSSNNGLFTLSPQGGSYFSQYWYAGDYNIIGAQGT